MIFRVQVIDDILWGPKGPRTIALGTNMISSPPTPLRRPHPVVEGSDKRAYLRHFGPKNGQKTLKKVFKLKFFQSFASNII